MSEFTYLSPLHPPLPKGPGARSRWGRLYGSATGLALCAAAREHTGPLIVVVTDTPAATRLEYELRFYSGDSAELPILIFPDWETLPYDIFSPHQDIVSQRLATLYGLSGLSRGIVIVPVATLMQRLLPRAYLDAHCLLLAKGDRLDIEQLRGRLDAAGYRYVSQVMEHGEFAVRGSLVDLYPMGSRVPYRIDLFDDEVESIRTFDPETQRSIDTIPAIELLPAREYPLDDAAITRFRQGFRVAFEGDPQRSSIYRDVSNGLAPPGIEYYLPLFFEQTSTLFDYLPTTALACLVDGAEEAAEGVWREVGERYEQGRYNSERPLLPPARLYLQVNEVFAGLGRFPQIKLQRFELEPGAGGANFATKAPPPLNLDVRLSEPAQALQHFLGEFHGRILFAAETAGRREHLLELLRGYRLQPTTVRDWNEFVSSKAALAITVAPLEQGLLLEAPALAVVAEPQLFGEQVLQRRRRKAKSREAENVVRNLAELEIGAPVVHEDHGVGRFLGLNKITAGGQENEYLCIEYADGDKLYVPVSSLHLISRYSGVALDNAPLHKLGSGQWERAKRKAAEKIRDVAAELLDIYARREARQGTAHPLDSTHYAAFAAGFPFEETPDQEQAIHAVIADMTTPKPMDRLVCGDVGFGKTEVAMRAAFIAVQAGLQVAVLVPTTLLAEQHRQNFADRFADLPIRVEALSRFQTKKELDGILKGIASGNVDIVIGTHKLLQPDVHFKRLGLVIIDEEHRFGVRQKERFKALRTEVDVLTLTATPIPRTMNMALSGMRDLSVIATPPAKRLSIKTFATQWNKDLVREACLREIKRGGQVYFVHNEVENIEQIAREVSELVPEATVRFAHGQMRERELERVMSDFYHHRFNLLICTTIIETGIDIPSANTMIINRADRFGLAQLYQLRGRVGRSHHRAYAYLIVPPPTAMTADAIKRLEALESIEDLGAGFTLATHDLEIRGAGELLGEEQSGQMQEIGFTLYMELLERAVKSLKAGKQPELDRPLDHGAEVDLGIPALIPDDYLPDVHSRLIMYKRIANAVSTEELHELQVEMIDRFGLLPEPVKTLFRVTELKLKATPLGIRKIEAGPGGGRLVFNDQPNIDPMRVISLIQTHSKIYKLDGKDRLKIVKELPDGEARITELDRLIDRLAGRKAA